MKQTVLVTGSSGMIGTALCERLLKEGFDVCGIDIKPNAWSKTVNAKTILVDLRNPRELKKIKAVPGLVVHLAANPFVFPSVENPPISFDNVSMTLNLLEYCRTNQVSRFVFASSREVYGNNSRFVRKEDDVSLLRCESPYAASKMAGEAFVDAYHRCFGIDYLILRFSNVYGRFDQSERLIPILYKKNRLNQNITIFGENKELPFTYLDDCIDGIMLGLQQFEKAKNQAFNIAHDTPRKIVDAARIMQSLMKSSNQLVMQSSRIGEVTRFCADISKAKKTLGFSPQTGLEEGLAKTIAWYKQNP